MIDASSIRRKRNPAVRLPIGTRVTISNFTEEYEVSGYDEHLRAYKLQKLDGKPLPGTYCKVRKKDTASAEAGAANASASVAVPPPLPPDAAAPPPHEDPCNRKVATRGSMSLQTSRLRMQMMDRLPPDIKRMVLSRYAGAAKLVASAKPTMQGHSKLVRELMLYCGKHDAAEFARMYSGLSVRNTKAVVARLQSKYSQNSIQASLGDIDEWLGSVDMLHRLVFVRFEPWGGITVLDVDWSPAGHKVGSLELLQYTFFDGDMQAGYFCHRGDVSIDPIPTDGPTLHDFIRRIVHPTYALKGAFAIAGPGHVTKPISSPIARFFNLPSIATFLIGLHEGNQLTQMCISHMYAKNEWVLGRASLLRPLIVSRFGSSPFPSQL